MLHVHPPHPTGETGPHAGAFWLDLVTPTEAEVSMVEDLLGFRLPTREQLTGIEQSSRLSFDDDVLRMAAPVVADANTDHPRITPLGILLTPKVMISIRYDALFMIESVAQRTGKDAPTSSVTAFTSVMQAYVARQADNLEEARARLDEVSHRVFRPAGVNTRLAMRHTVVMRDKLQLLGRMGERISIIRESLLGIDRMVDFAGDNAKTWFTGDLPERLSQVCEDIGALSQFEEHLLGKVQFLLDAVLGFISIEQNDIFKVLTIASVVGIFPTLVAGWFGMNFANMPELHWQYGYQFGIGVIILSTIAPLLWFKCRGWM